MKPWPEWLSKLYPLANFCHPRRPWWRESRGRWRRVGIDGAVQEVKLGSEQSFINAPAAGCYFMPLVPSCFDATSWRSWLRPGSLEDVLAELDRAQPISFPGWRAGQAWAVEALRSSRGESYNEVALICTDTITDDAQSSIECATGGIRFPGTRRLLRDCYLVVDLCCPWLAPWAPAESPMEAPNAL